MHIEYRSKRRGRLSGEDGQAAVEFILVLPLLFLVVVLALQAFEVVGNLSQALVFHRNRALREAARVNATASAVPQLLLIESEERHVDVLAGLRGVFPGKITVRSVPDGYQVWAGTERD